jgi:hypothetical protein
VAKVDAAIAIGRADAVATTEMGAYFISPPAIIDAPAGDINAPSGTDKALTANATLVVVFIILYNMIFIFTKKLIGWVRSFYIVLYYR